MTKVKETGKVRICDMCGYVFTKDGLLRRRLSLSLDGVRMRYDLCEHCADRWWKNFSDGLRGEHEFTRKIHSIEMTIKTQEKER